MKFSISNETPAVVKDYGHHVPVDRRGKIISTPEGDKIIAARAAGGPCASGKKLKKSA